MMNIRFTAVAVFLIVPLSLATAQNKMLGAPDSEISASDAQKHFTHDPSVHYQAAVKPQAGDWNAPGVVDTRTMTDTQFAQFKALHPNAVFVNRCFVGASPDPAARAQLRQTYGTDGSCGS